METSEIKISINEFKLYIRAFLDLDNFFNKNYQEVKEKNLMIKDSGYLIDKKCFDDLKEKLSYSEFIKYINDDIKFDQMLKEIYRNKEYIPIIPCDQKIFKTSEELENSIQKNNEYMIINNSVLKLINNEKYKENEGKIEYEINNEYLIISFSAEENVYFKYNINIINIKNLLPGLKNIINNISTLETNEQNIIEINIKKKNNNKKFDNYIKILMSFYLNDEYINNNIKKKFEKNSLFEDCYVFNKNYINKLKEIFNYKEFCKIITKEDFFKNNESINFNELTYNKEFIEDLGDNLSQTQFIESLPNNIKKILHELKNNEEITKINKIYLNKEELYYYNDFEIISNSLYRIFEEENLVLKKEQNIKTKCLFGENKIFFYPVFPSINNLIITKINNDNEFIPEIILSYDNSTSFDKHIKEIKTNGYENTILNLIFKNNEAKIYLEFSNESIGVVYKINGLNIKLSEELEEVIYFMIKLYLFNLDLKNNLSLSEEPPKNDAFEKYMETEKCYLINKEWMSEYKKYYLYDELYNHLIKEEIKQKLNINDKNRKYFSNININKIYDEILDNSDFLKKFFNKEPKMIDEKLIEVKEKILGKKNNKEIKYYDEFVLVNSDINKIIINKYKKANECHDFFINFGKSIISLNNNKICQILIGSLNLINDECNFIPDSLIDFEDNKELKFHFEKLKNINLQIFKEQIKNGNYKIFDKDNTREVGTLYNLDKMENEIHIVDNKEEEKITKYLIELYFAFDNLNFIIKDSSKKLSSEKEYYLVNKELRNYFNKCYNYDQIIKLINKYEKNEGIIKKNRDCYNMLLDENEINDLINTIPEEIKKDINNKDKTYDKSLFKSFIKNLKEENQTIYYYNECLLIDEKIKNILINLNEIRYKFSKKVNCFIDLENRIFVFYKLKNNLIISVGKLNEEDIFETNIIMTLKFENHYNNFYKKIIFNNKIPPFFNQLKEETKRTRKIKNTNGNIIGFIFLLDNFKDNESDLDENQNKGKEEKNIKIIKDEIKKLLKYFIFNKKLIDDIESSAKKPNEKIICYKNSKYYLISSNFMNIFRKHYMTEELISIINNKFGNNLSNNDDLIINQIFDELIHLDIYKTFEHNINTDLILEENIFEFEYNIIHKKDIDFICPKNLEIFDENFYTDFIQRKNIKYQNKIIETDIIINNGKIIIGFNNKELDLTKKDLILIGHVNNGEHFDSKFICDILLNTADIKNINTMIAAIKYMNYINAINNEKLMQNFLIHYFDKSLRKKDTTQIKSAIYIDSSELSEDFNLDNISYSVMDSGKNIIKLFIILFLSYEELNEKINGELKTNSEERYFLINKEFMRKYKEYYNYQKIINILQNDENIKSFFLQNHKQIIYYIKNKINYESYISPIIELFQEDFIYELGIKRENQDDILQKMESDKFVNFLLLETQKGNKLKYYEGNEIINYEFIDLFTRHESEKLINLVNKQVINCLFGEKKVFINLCFSEKQYYYLDIGHLDNCIFMSDLIICFVNKPQLIKCVNIIKEKTFEQFIIPHLKNINENSISSFFDDKGKILGKFIKIKDLSDNYKLNEIKNQELNRNSKIILKLIAYNNQFLNRVKHQIKEGETNSGYFIKNDFMTEIHKLKLYQKIFKYISNNDKIQKLLKDNPDMDYNILYQNVLKEFDVDTINNINKENNEIKIYTHSYKINFTLLKLNTNNLTYITNNFIIINEEIYKLFTNEFNYSDNGKFIYFYRNNKIFALIDKQQYKNTISIYYINDRKELQLKLLLNFFNQNERDECIKLIKEIGFDKYQAFLLFDENGLVSPIFDINQKQIGNAYKYNSSIRDYTNYNISFEIRKIFLLYLNYQKLIKNPSINTYKFREYYIINKNWIQNYKKYYNYDSISSAIDKNNLIQNAINNLLNRNDSNDFNINDKLLTLMMKQLPKYILDDFNIKDKNIKNFQNTEQKGSYMATFSYGPNKDFFYHYDFELISAEIYDYLFYFLDSLNINNNFQNKVMDLDKVEKVECLVDKKYILIKFLNQNAENKFLLEIGNLNSEKIFEPEFFLLYDNLTCLNNHVKIMMNLGGFNDFCEKLQSLSINTLDIINNNIKYGIAIKKNINQIYNERKFPSDQNLTKELLLLNAQKMNKLNIEQNPNNNKQGNNYIINQKDSQLFSEDNKIVLKNIFPWPPMVGLNNLGGNFFMNSILQCFCQIEELVVYFKYDNHVNEICDGYIKYLTPSFKKLIEEIWPKEAENNESRYRQYSPHEFEMKIADMNPVLMNNPVNDSAQDLINFIIKTLHEELNTSIFNYNINEMNSDIRNNNQIDNAFQLFYEEYQRSYNSKISELFYAISQTKIQCLYCKNCQYNYQVYYFLVFSLEEVKQYAINKLNNIINNNNQINIHNNIHMNNNLMINCSRKNINMRYNNANNNNIFVNKFNNFSQNMDLGNNNQRINLVNNNINNNINNNFVLLSLNILDNNGPIPMSNPNLNIKRNKNNVNINSIKLSKLNNNIVNISDCFDYYNEKVEYFNNNNQIYCNYCYQMLNMTYSSNLATAPKILIILLNRGIKIQYKIKLEFTTELDITKYVIKKSGNIKYKLISVITHLADTGEGGNYVAHCLSPIDNRWYTYNDSNVKETDNFQKQVIDIGIPYLLFYQKID